MSRRRFLASPAEARGALNEYLYTALYGLQDLAGHWALPEIGPLVSAAALSGRWPSRPWS